MDPPVTGVARAPCVTFVLPIVPTLYLSLYQRAGPIRKLMRENKKHAFSGGKPMREKKKHAYCAGHCIDPAIQHVTNALGALYRPLCHFTGGEPGSDPKTHAREEKACFFLGKHMRGEIKHAYCIYLCTARRKRHVTKHFVPFIVSISARRRVHIGKPMHGKIKHAFFCVKPMREKKKHAFFHRHATLIGRD